MHFMHRIYIPVYLFLYPVSTDPPTVVTSLATDTDDDGMFVLYLTYICSTEHKRFMNRGTIFAHASQLYKNT